MKKSHHRVTSLLFKLPILFISKIVVDGKQHTSVSIPLLPQCSIHSNSPIWSAVCVQKLTTSQFVKITVPLLVRTRERKLKTWPYLQVSY